MQGKIIYFYTSWNTETKNIPVYNEAGKIFPFQKQNRQNLGAFRSKWSIFMCLIAVCVIHDEHKIKFANTVRPAFIDT